MTPFSLRGRHPVEVLLLAALCAFGAAAYSEDAPPAFSDQSHGWLGDPVEDEIVFTAISDVKVRPLAMTLKLFYGRNQAGQAWAFYSADLQQVPGESRRVAEDWLQASPEWILESSANEIIWTDEGGGGRLPSSDTGVRIYMAGCREDADGDGLPDADEALIHGTNPFLDDDADGDGLSDAEEILVTGTHPKLRDTDGDGVDDGLEVLQGRNPLVAGALADEDRQIALQVFTPGF